MLKDPRNDHRIRALKAIAIRGGEFGPHYDEGVLSVIGQIERTGSFIPNPLRGLAALEVTPTVLTPGEKAQFESELKVRGWSVEEGAAYSKGIGAAEIELADYKSANNV